MAAAAELRQRGAKAGGPIDVDVVDKAKVDPYDESNLPVFTPHNFTMKELLRAIPKECFERSYPRAMMYVVSDFARLAALVYAASFIDSAFGSNGSLVSGPAGLVAKWSLWSAYWVAAGLVATGVWILGHECGHQAFSSHKFLNNTTGLILHSLVLVPFHPWRITHAMHHAHTGHVERDEVFVPRTRTEKGIPPKGDASIKKIVKNGIELDDLLEDVPAYRLFWLVMQQVVGWPLYLFTNVTSNSHYPEGTNHFLPSSALFKPHQANDVITSDIALGAVIALLTYTCKQFNGLETFAKYYFVPYLFVNHWLVAITYLQHTDPSLPHYRGADWNFARGAYASIDRKFFGWVGPYVLHGITETHVAHHLVSKIPHYNAWKATDALRAYCGPHHLSSDENFLVSLWKSYRNCRFVDDEGTTVMMRDSQGRAAYRVEHASVEDSGVDVTEK